MGNQIRELSVQKFVSNRNPLTTLVLFIFLGGIGVHRFYLGRVGTGILFAFTGALCGIGLIYDFFKLLFSGIRDNEGNYLRLSFLKKLLLFAISFIMWSISILLFISILAGI